MINVAPPPAADETTAADTVISLLPVGTDLVKYYHASSIFFDESRKFDVTF